jgi:hypothetical protein
VAFGAVGRPGRLIVRFGFESQRGRVDAVAFTRLISRAVGKEMAQVAATLAANYLGALHAVAVVLVSLDIALADDVPETGPARARMKFGSGGE